MTGKFMMSSETAPETLDWGKLRWCSDVSTEIQSGLFICEY